MAAFYAAVFLILNSLKSCNAICATFTREIIPQILLPRAFILGGIPGQFLNNGLHHLDHQFYSILLMQAVNLSSKYIMIFAILLYYYLKQGLKYLNGRFFLYKSFFQKIFDLWLLQFQFFLCVGFFYGLLMLILQVNAFCKLMRTHLEYLYSFSLAVDTQQVFVG